MIAVLAQMLPTTDVMLFGAITMGLLAALRGNHVSTDKHFAQMVKSIDKVVAAHEKTSDKIVAGLGGVKDSVATLGEKIDKHGQKIRNLIQHVKGEFDDDESS